MTTLVSGIGDFFQKVLRPVSVSFRGGKTYLTLDIGTSSVKMLEIQDTDGALQVMQAGIEPLPSNTVQAGLIQDPARLAVSLQSLIEAHQIKTTDVVTALPGSVVVSKRLTLPAQEPSELHQSILFEAGNVIPESLEEMSIDYQVLDRTADTQTVDILLVAVRKDVLEGYVTAMRQAGLVPRIVDVDYFALENGFELNYQARPDETIGLIDIGAQSASIHIVEDGQSACTAEVPVGGQHLTHFLAQELGIDHGQAERLKLGAEDRDAVQPLLARAAQQLVDEVQRGLGFAWSDAGQDQLHTIYVSGGSARLPGLVSTMATRLGIKTEIFEPFRLLDVHPSVDDVWLDRHAASFAVGVGLATRRPGDR